MVDGKAKVRETRREGRKRNRKVKSDPSLIGLTS
jgi:hypothetical protein